MPITPTLAQSEASRLNGARSGGPATPEGRARAALSSVRHGLTGRTFFLLPDEDPDEFAAHEAEWLAEWRPRDTAERDLAELAVRALWREIRADRMEAQILTDLFGADSLAGEAERRAMKAAAMKALGTLLRYRRQIEREYASAMRDLNALRRRAPKPATPRLQDEPERSPELALASGPERAPNRHERRALEAMRRKQAA